MIGYMGSQQRKQLEGLEELVQFTSRETGLFMTSVYPYLQEQVHQNLARAALALTWLNEDMTVLNGTPNQSQLNSFIGSIEDKRSQVFCYTGRAEILMHILPTFLVTATSSRAGWF